MSNDNKYEDDNSREDDVEEYEISNLLSYFKKNNISVHGIFTHEGRTVFMFIQYLTSGLDFFVYIPSKYFIKPDNSVKNYFHVNLKLDEEEKVVNSIFINNHSNNIRGSVEGSLNRFVPLFQDSIYKLVYINKEMLTYINRYDTVDSFTFSSPFNKVGYYFMTDLENFYKESNNLEKNVILYETLLYTKINNTFDNELPRLYNVLTDISVDAKKFSGKTENKTYNDRIRRIGEIINKNKREGKSISDCISLNSTVRSSNFKNIFYMEKIIQFLKEMDDLK
jgi:hypothetical protein